MVRPRSYGSPSVRQRRRGVAAEGQRQDQGGPDVEQINLVQAKGGQGDERGRVRRGREGSRVGAAGPPRCSRPGHAGRQPRPGGDP